jgi:hypothetical protein
MRKLPPQLSSRALAKLKQSITNNEGRDGTPEKIYGSDWADVHELVDFSPNGCQRTRPKIQEEWTL